MRRLACTFLALGLFAIAPPCLAQDGRANLRRDTPRVAATGESLGVPSPTPEMWFYQQERERHDDPRSNVHRRAAVRGQQRQDRLASLSWYGISNARPTVTPTPWFGTYSAGWGSNSYDPFLWRTPTTPIVVRPLGAY